MCVKIYYLDKTIFVCKDNKVFCDGETCETLYATSGVNFSELLQKLRNTNRLVIISDSVDDVVSQLASGLRVIEAGGGVVTNPAGDILMIFRHNRWDLPKGKLEQGELIDECAVREVEEECGISGVQLGRPLTVTYHLYQMNGEWVLKLTHWYTMTYNGTEPLVPQREEFITDIAWAQPSKLDKYLKTTYATIIDVFAAAGFSV